MDDQMYADTELDKILLLYSEMNRVPHTFISEKQQMCVALMRNPVSVEKSVAIFGAMLGLFPPAAVLMNITSSLARGWWIVIYFAPAILVTTLVGYRLGSTVANVLRKLERLDWIMMTLFVMLLGGAWGALSGIAGGLPIFVVGAIAGGYLGAIVGGIALPIFAIFHRFLNVDGFLDRRVLVPLTAGISLSISAVMLAH
jgi:hypothetical protein